MRVLVGLLAVSLLASPALAQRIRPIEQGARQNAPKKVLAGEERARFLIQGLELTQEQRDHAAGLFQMLFSADPSQQINLERVQQLVKEMEAAKAAGDTARQEEIQAELRGMGQKADASDEFLDNMVKVLTPEQQTALNLGIERLKRNPGGEFQAVDVLRAVEAAVPNSEQLARIDAGLAEFRRKQNRGRGPREEREAKLLDQLATDLRAVFSEDQAKKFDAYLAVCRP